MQIPRTTLAEEHYKYFPGKMMHLGEGPAWQNLVVEIHKRNPVENVLLIPAVAEPQLLWQISGHVLCSDRDLGGQWSTHEVSPGDLFLTVSSEPYELKWKTLTDAPIIVMHLTLGLPLLARAIQELEGPAARIPRLKEFNAIQDPTITAFLEMLYQELARQKHSSPLFVQGIGQSLATHLIRSYRDEENPTPHRPTALPAFQLHRILKLMEDSLEEGLKVGQLAEALQLSEAHFSRLFKGNTGFPPSQYFIRLRMSKAQELLRTTRKTIIEIGLEVGYTSPSHFAQIFRKETGLSPNEYRQRLSSNQPAEDFSRITTG